jgi:hypothetical protein
LGEVNGVKPPLEGRKSLFLDEDFPHQEVACQGMMSIVLRIGDGEFLYLTAYFAIATKSWMPRLFMTPARYFSHGLQTHAEKTRNVHVLFNVSENGIGDDGGISQGLAQEIGLRSLALSGEETDMGTGEVIRKIKRATRRRFSAEEKIRIVLEGLRGEMRFGP